MPDRKIAAIYSSSSLKLESTDSEKLLFLELASILLLESSAVSGISFLIDRLIIFGFSYRAKSNISLLRLSFISLSFRLPRRLCETDK
jgi:hypothetical protein